MCLFQGGATFWRKKVTLTCPGSGSWFDGANKNLSNVDTNMKNMYTFDYQRQVWYNCKYGEKPDEKSYAFYIKGKGE